jgi:hypothetical protein
MAKTAGTATLVTMTAAAAPLPGQSLSARNEQKERNAQQLEKHSRSSLGALPVRVSAFEIGLGAVARRLEERYGKKRSDA